MFFLRRGGTTFWFSKHGSLDRLLNHGRGRRLKRHAFTLTMDLPHLLKWRSLCQSSKGLLIFINIPLLNLCWNLSMLIRAVQGDVERGEKMWLFAERDQWGQSPMEKWGPFSFNWYLGPGFIPGLAGRTGGVPSTILRPWGLKPFWFGRRFLGGLELWEWAFWLHFFYFNLTTMILLCGKRRLCEPLYIYTQGGTPQL